MKAQHEKYMLRALELARKGLGNVSPNPMVGCVIVYGDKIIGEGYHKKYGGPHAEVNAINSVKNKNLLTQSTLYVTLEPCAHFGKTPPCANLIVEHKISHVVICNTDPFPEVNGKGIAILEKAGVKVETGILEQEGREINRRFFTAVEKKRSYVILKWAQTLDGFVARENFDSKWISNASSRKLVHKWRTEEDAILVGYNTAKYDDPKLTARDWDGKDPVRVVIDKALLLQKDQNLFDGSTQTICFNEQKDEQNRNLEYIKVECNDINVILKELGKRKIQSVIVEGGAVTLRHFIESNYWDEARVFTSEAKFGSGISAPILDLPPFEELSINGDRLSIYLKR